MSNKHPQCGMCGEHPAEIDDNGAPGLMCANRTCDNFKVKHTIYGWNFRYRAEVTSQLPTFDEVTARINALAYAVEVLSVAKIDAAFAVGQLRLAIGGPVMAKENNR